MLFFRRSQASELTSFSPLVSLSLSLLEFQDKIPTDVVPEKVAAPPPKEEPIAEEEGDATTVESGEDPAAEPENAEPNVEEEAPATETKEISLAEEEKSAKQTPFTCCDGEVLKNLQAACGLA